MQPFSAPLPAPANSVAMTDLSLCPLVESPLVEGGASD
jgi:hypothetical protein